MFHGRGVKKVKKVNPVDFMVISAPVEIKFYCPYCETENCISWGRVIVPECWNGKWDDVECLKCGEIVELGNYDYD